VLVFDKWLTSGKAAFFAQMDKVRLFTRVVFEKQLFPLEKRYFFVRAGRPAPGRIAPGAGL
jgi:hypothetical protein